MSDARIGQPAPAALERTKRARPRLRLSLDPRGQGLVEFAISFPVVMLMILFGIDFGRVFLGWVTLTNAVREAANYAAINPRAWEFPGSPNARAEYVRLITAESTGSNCALPATLPDPSFPNGNDLGSPVIVAITCEFSLITPIIGDLLGNPLDVSSSASFPVRSGSIMGAPPGGGPLPTVGTVIPTPSPIVTIEPIPTPSAAPTPVPACVVPDLKNDNSSTATAEWTGAGFAANNLAFNPLVPPHYRIRTQTLTKSTSVPCTSSMTVTP